MKKEKAKTNGATRPEIDLPDIAPPDPTVATVEREMVEAEEKCKRLDEVEHELSALREKVRGMEAERAKHTATLEAAAEERRKFAFAASDGDPAAQEKLRKARAAQAEAQLALEDSESAVDEGRRRFEALESEQAELLPFVSWRDAMKLAKQVLEESWEIDVHLEGFVAALAGHQERLQALRQLAQDSGREIAFRTVGVRQTMRVLSTRLAALWPLEFEKFSKDYREKSYGEILRMQVQNGLGHGAAAQAEGEDHAASGAQAEENEASA